jgi:hypothetical protein
LVAGGAGVKGRGADIEGRGTGSRVDRLSGTGVEGQGAHVTAVDWLGGAGRRRSGGNDRAVAGSRACTGVEGGRRGGALGPGGGDAGRVEMAQGGA